MNLKTAAELGEKTVLGKIGDWFKSVITDIGDRFHTNDKYYRYDKKPEPLAEIRKITEQPYNLEDRFYIITNIIYR
ncbi:putative conjugative transfer TraA domain protein [Orientia chuto str. Dubai]|uniref:Putative conjugative transfer TraA domain protein n=1 Tax=Orientia chuto str. Dubai TaxID=1359168 RepID=A0A0F3MPB0_9RICK|nr:hypothetical protein [Candidatus Orientia mediorientalis]KJV56449.1 putative conjugative transfer TraA domain protein [Orientia chuto str. Dubai]